MNAYEMRCYSVAGEIEQCHAMDLARRYVGRGPKKTWEYFYDAHAATELGSLIGNLCATSACNHTARVQAVTAAACAAAFGSADMLIY